MHLETFQKVIKGCIKYRTHKIISHKHSSHDLIVTTAMAVSLHGARPSCLIVVHCSTVGVIPAPSRAAAAACTDSIQNVKGLFGPNWAHRHRRTSLNVDVLTKGALNRGVLQAIIMAL